MSKSILTISYCIVTEIQNWLISTLSSTKWIHVSQSCHKGPGKATERGKRPEYFNNVHMIEGKFFF